MNEQKDQIEAACGGSALTAELGGCMPDREWGLCKPECPMLAKWEHPFWHHTAWCWHLMKDLEWYDYWQAACIRKEPDQRLVGMRGNGRTVPPNA